MAEATTDAKQIVNAYVSLWNERDYAKIPELVSEEFVMHDPGAPEEEVPGPAREVHGPDGLEMFIRGVTAGFPDFHVSIGDTLSSDELVMCEGKITMTHEGEFDGIPPTRRKVEVREMSKYRIADGKIQEHRVYFDQREVFDQLGLTEE
jgi:steroid delta-isomerase-like uncharacterized protein